MAHLSLYRKYRPASFDKIVRQEHVVRVLTNQIERGEVGHAYLFTGPRGTGKTSVARIFARAVNCEHPVNGSPCGKCPACLALSENTLDIAEIDAASNNGVGEMRDLREKVQYPPVNGKYKVYIIDEVHMLTDSAFNALLKTLEEPPAHAIFILATTEPHKIPATILSRCMRLDFKLIPEEDLEAHLKGILDEMGRAYEPEAVAAIARAGAGSDRDMLSIAEMCLAYGDKLTYAGVTGVLGSADFSTNAGLVGAILGGDVSAALAAAEEALAAGKGVGVLLKDLLQLLNRVSIAKTCPNAEKLLALPKEFFQKVKKIAEKSDGRAVLRAAEIFARAENELRFASSPRISLETAILRAAMPQADADTDALLLRVAALEKQVERLMSGGAAVRQTADRREAPPAAEPAAEELPPLPEPPPDDGEGASDPTDIPVRPVPPVPPASPAPKREPAASPDGAQEAPFSAPPQGLREGADDSPEAVFGLFLRSLRKLPRSGVVYALCRDLSPSREGETLVLSTDVRTVSDTLNGERHRPLMQEVFAGLGVTQFEVRFTGADRTRVRDGVEQIKEDFAGYPVEVK